MDEARLLLVSTRRYEEALWRCGLVECEDVIRAVDDVDLIELTTSVRGEGLLARKAARLCKRLAGIELAFTPRLEPVPLTRDYELLCLCASHTTDLAVLDALPGWRRRCARAVLLIDELWIEDLQHTFWRERMAQFDLVCVMFHDTVAALRDETGLACAWVPPAVDTLRFFPGLSAPPRTIDLYAMGRRSEQSHEVMLAAAEARGWTYLFDSVAAHGVRDGMQQHRQQLAELIKRSRYFIANKAKIDQPAHRGTQEELGLRSFEGAAGGAVLLGDTPHNASLTKLFDWPDAHVYVPFGSTRMAEVMDELDADPARVSRIRRENVVQSLLRHDWCHRWRQVLQLLKLAPHPRLSERIARLAWLADRTQATSMLDRASETRLRFAGG